MADLMSKLQEILASKEGQEQFNNIASMLNKNQTTPQSQDNSNNQNFNQQNNEQNNQQNNNSGGGLDFASIASMLSGLGGNSDNQNNQNNQSNQSNQNNQSNQQENNDQNTNSGGGFDMSSIASMLSGLGGNSNNGQQANTQNPLGNIDLGMIMNMQKAFQAMNQNDKNSDLLLALKPHFSEKRQSKVDQAIKIMNLISMLPMLKESGILKGIF